MQNIIYPFRNVDDDPDVVDYRADMQAAHDQAAVDDRASDLAFVLATYRISPTNLVIITETYRGLRR